MDVEETKINMVCLISSSDFKKGRLSLPLPFYCEYGNDLPEKMKLHVKSVHVWEATFDRRCFYIEGLEDMMSFYKLKAHHLARLHYIGDGHFNLHIYTPYGVEMNYPTDSFRSQTDLRCSVLEADKLGSIFRYNVKENFVGLYNLQIQEKHLAISGYTQVLCPYACYQLRIIPSVKFIRIGFEKNEWKIRVKWIDGEAFFSEKWCQFVQAADLVPGDVVCLYKTPSELKFKACVFDCKTVAEETLGQEVCQISSYVNFFKIMGSNSLEAGELELPRLFMNNYGHTVADVITIELGGGYCTKFKYSLESKKIHGLIRFIGKYCVDDEYFLFFNYLGNSTFALTVYDTQRMDHLRDILGYPRLEDFMNPPYDTEVVLVSSESEDNDSGRYCMELMSLTDNPIGIVNADEDLGDESIIFHVELKKSHGDEQCHGAYLPPITSRVYKKWGRRTAVTLTVGGMQWNVDVVQNKRSCRFGKGWNKFTFDNNLMEGQVIAFRFIGNFMFEVTRVG